MEKQWIKFFDADTVSKLAHIGFKPSMLVEGNLVGNHPSPFHGFAIEFAGHRGYVPGDDVRYIDWKAYYKTEKYLLKQYEQETNFLAHILVDFSSSMKFEHKNGSKKDYSAFIATALAQIIVNQSDSIGVDFIDSKIIEKIKISNSEEVVSRISSFFQEKEPEKPSDLGTVLNLLAEQLGRRRVIFIISDFYCDSDRLFDGIKKLLDSKHEIVMLQIIDPIEMNFDIMNRVELTDIEGDEKLVFRGPELKDSYEELFNGFLNETRERAMSLGIDYILCDMAKPFGFHLAEYLSGREFRT